MSPEAKSVTVKPAGTCGTCPSKGSVSERLVTIGEDFGAGSWAGSMLKRRPISCSAMKFSLSASGAGGAAVGCARAGRAQSAIESMSSDVSERRAMVVSRNDDVQCSYGRRGARDPPAAAGGEECGGTPAREAKSSEGKGGV